MESCLFVCSLFCLASTGVNGHPSHVQPQATDKDCVCKKDDPVCYCTLRIEHKLTMILEKEKGTDISTEWQIEVCRRAKIKDKSLHQSKPNELSLPMEKGLDL